jgi:uncharacterized protein
VSRLDDGTAADRSHSVLTGQVDAEARFPLGQFIVKVHARCNLACDYCYIYEMADQSWRSRPYRMSEETVVHAAERIAVHAARHGLPRVRIVLHGGEPLLAGADFLGFVASTVRGAVPPPTEVDLSIQTNGVLLGPEMLDVLSRHDIGVGVSVDGGAEDHDRHRRYPDGRGSHSAVEQGLKLLAEPRYQHLYRGLLCTVDLDNDPLRTYQELARLAPPRLDLLLPHGNWTLPPPGRPADPEATPYADWLGVIFDAWYPVPAPRPGIRLFEEIIHLLLGGSSGTESVGLTPSTLIVVETDGSIEQVDALKSAYEGAAATGLHVEHDDFDLAMNHPAIAERQSGIDALSATCKSCRLVQICGGGYYPHRYREGSGFANPSVYCPDLLALIDHIRGRLSADLTALKGSA